MDENIQVDIQQVQNLGQEEENNLQLDFARQVISPVTVLAIQKKMKDKK
jgi:hypothetical protein